MVGRKMMTSARMNPPIPPPISQGFASAGFSPSALFQENAAAITRTNSKSAVFFVTPDSVMTAPSGTATGLAAKVSAFNVGLEDRNTAGSPFSNWPGGENRPYFKIGEELISF